jgi:Amidohydrolase family
MRFIAGVTRLLAMLALMITGADSLAQAADLPESVKPAPDRAEGEGPYSRLVIRAVTIIDGTGAPAYGPADVVVEGNRITEIAVVGAPGVPIENDGRPAKGDREIDGTGKYLLPGFIDAHSHISNPDQYEFGEAAPAEYVYKLWMAHGVTTIRETGSANGRDWTLNEKRRSAANAITAPRIVALTFFPAQLNAKEAVAWVRDLKKAGGDGVKFLGGSPEALTAAFKEIKALGLHSAFHHAQLSVARWNVLDSARAGLESMEHWYGLPEALFDDRTVQDYPDDYNYANEADRFGQAGRLWKQAAMPGSEKWNAVMNELLSLDFTIDPTFGIYEASRDQMAARTQEWLPDYTWPALWAFYQPSRTSHASYWYDWTTADEIAWKENYRLWMAFVNEYKNRGGRVTAGDDAGYIYKLYGFAYIRELEMLQEAGFHPLEVIRAATLSGAELVGMADQIGTVERGKLADLVLVGENPLHNLKVLYGTGAVYLNADNQVERIGGVLYTIKDGIVYDAKQLLADVRNMVAAEKARTAANP